jgi:hypothetical protein
MGWGKKTSKKSKYNNTKSVDKYGENVDSNLEGYAKSKFEESLFDFTFQYTVKLFEPFKAVHGKTVRTISVTPDFYFPPSFLNEGVHLFVDTKGKSDDATCLRWKLLEHKLHSDGLIYNTIWLRSTNDVDKFVKRMKESRPMTGIGKKDY